MTSDFSTSIPENLELFRLGPHDRLGRHDKEELALKVVMLGHEGVVLRRQVACPAQCSANERRSLG